MNENLVVPREKLEWSLFGLRLGVFTVLIMWTLDKFINPDHAALVMKVFYSIPALSSGVSYLLGGLQLILIVSFLVGFQKRWVTLIILVMHFGSTLVSFGRYMDPWSGSNLLFFAAWPMLAAIVTLYLLRDLDRKWSLSK
ncbi:hypothetical protein J9B83_12500 [Marinomonas sp. A79]|uniref:DoxX n=1 Tax=Marinomonas vulgaris TaxID=2823372 RepID=A0ABS5HE35_9GAMM|nr:hypothetical protein [Marinomonas vulgaris]MBR7889755.1 hypothetical protein [Marinomonas vulgaris]